VGSGKISAKNEGGKREIEEGRGASKQQPHKDKTGGRIPLQELSWKGVDDKKGGERNRTREEKMTYTNILAGLLI